MLCPAQADSLCAILHSIRRICGCICIGAHFKSAVLVRPLHDSSEVTADRSFHGLDIAFINLTGGAVQGHVIALMEDFSAQFKYFILFIDRNLTTAGYAGRTHTAGHYCCMRGHTAAHGKDTFCGMHPFNIFRRGLQTYQYDSLPFLMSCFCLIGCKIHFTCRSTGRCGKCLSHYLACLQGIRIKGRMQKLIQGFCFNTKHCLFRGNLAFIYQIAGNL